MRYFRQESLERDSGSSIPASGERQAEITGGIRRKVKGMPSDYLEIEQIRASLAYPAIVAKEAFGILSNISHLLDEGDSRQVSQELVLRALESRKHFGNASIVLDALVRQVGLFPYLSPNDLGGGRIKSPGSSITRRRCRTTSFFTNRRHASTGSWFGDTT